MAQGDRMTSSLARTRAIALVGLDGNIVDVETHVGRGLVNFTLVGLPDASLRESRDRVRSALQACELEVLDRHVTVGLSPAGLPKSGSGFDFSIAASILLATSKIRSAGVAGEVFIGELALDGSLHTLPGILPAVISARRSGITRVFVPLEARNEALLVPGIEVCAFAHLADFVQAFGGQAKRAPVLGVAAQESVLKNTEEEKMRSGGAGDFSQVRGHNSAIEAVAIAASGGHHLMMIGEPGSGKTMMASRLPSILPELEQSDALTASAIHSIAGDLSSGELLTEPPFQAPHHSMSIPAMVGGGSGLIRPGA
ncbi:MAG: ATP-binding protein, partial [Actinomyces sp. oral taxon 181]|nr:ATP-binding protein [Actinomyces sp. oral taxon 181]